MSRRIEPYDEENDEIAQEKKKIKARMAAEAAEEAKKKAAAAEAAAPARPHPGAEQLEQLMTCCICMDRYRIPKMLPCQHSFCAHCLEGLYDWVKRLIKCPECRTEHHCSNPENYPTNLTLVRFMEIHIEAMGGDPSLAMEPPPQLQRCGVCGDNAELTKCAHCDRKICTDCRDGHAEILKRELNRLINQIKRGVTRLEESAGWIERNETQLETNCVAVKEEIRDVVKRYTKEIKDREEILLNQVDSFLQAESRSMRNMQENLLEEVKTLSSALEEAQKLLSDSGTTVEDLMNESAGFKEQFQKSAEFLKNFTPDAQEFTKSLRFLRGPSEPDLLHQCILAFGELHVNTMHFNRFVSASERMATQLVERQFEATLAEYNRQQQEAGDVTPQQRNSTYNEQPSIQVSAPRFESEYMTRRVGEDLREYRDRRLEASPSRYATTALEFPTRSDYIRESSAPASYLARVNRLTDTSSSGADTGATTGRNNSTSTSSSSNDNSGGSARRQRYKDSRSQTADLGALRESMDESGRRGSGQESLDGEVADALANRGRYATRRMEPQDSTESVSGDGNRRRYTRAKTSEFPDPYTASLETPTTRLYQRDTATPDTSSRAGRTGASACEQAIARRRRRFGSTQNQSQDDPVTPVATAASTYSTRNAYTPTATRETSPVSGVRGRGRTPGLDDSDEERRDREERMPYYSRYLANKAKSRETSPTGGATSALSSDSAYLRKGRSSTKIGSRGSETGQLNWPRGVATTSDSRVLVADSSNHRALTRQSSQPKDVLLEITDALSRSTSKYTASAAASALANPPQPNTTFSPSSSYNYRTRYVPRYTTS